jgi:hypothetical protein
VLIGCAEHGGDDERVVVGIDGDEERVGDGGEWKDEDDGDASDEQGAVGEAAEDEDFFWTNAYWRLAFFTESKHGGSHHFLHYFFTCGGGVSWRQPKKPALGSTGEQPLEVGAKRKH